MTQPTVGRYQIIREIGQGGMATVYLARDPRFNRDVAVKVLSRYLLQDPTFRSRFDREARAIASLEHPAIVPVYDYEGREDEAPYIVMRYMSGGSLGTQMAQGRVAIDDMVKTIIRLASALDFAHRRGIVHRDLKPDNVLFDQWGLAYLSDFGLVKLVQSSIADTGSGVVGTPAYMSPEQARGRGEIDGRSDVYNLGTILFELLTGQQPFQADTPMGMMVAHLTEPVPDICAVNEDLPPACVEVIQKALAKDPDERYSTAGELAGEVRELFAEHVSNAFLAELVTTFPSLAKQTPASPDETWAAIDNPAGIEWVKIPGGEFPFGEYGRTVTLEKAFLIGKFPVTNKQYKLFLDANPQVSPPAYWSQERRTFPEGTADHPVIMVSWHDANLFCEWANCRLASEIEWEKAARGEDARRYPWGDDWQDGKCCNSYESRLGKITPVDAFPGGVSPHGVWDMAGNVWEWTSSTGQSKALRVVRGGSWMNFQHGVRACARKEYGPSVTFDDVGFRCARDL